MGREMVTRCSTLEGKTIRRDPIGLAGGLNTYQYVDGDPVSHVDPIGLAKGDKNFGINDKGFWKWWEREKYGWGPFDGTEGFNPDKPFDIPNKDIADAMKQEYDACKTRDSGRGGKTRGGKPNINDLIRRGGRGGGRGSE